MLPVSSTKFDSLSLICPDNITEVFRDRKHKKNLPLHGQNIVQFVMYSVIVRDAGTDVTIGGSDNSPPGHVPPLPHSWPPRSRPPEKER